MPFIHGPGTVGREDRLVRGCIALSLILLAGFALAMSGQSNAFTIVFLVGGLYFAVTAALGRDPFYTHFGVDTRSSAHLDAVPEDHQAWPPVQDGRHTDSYTSPEPTGRSLLGS